jgi:hypothetical protein
VVLLLPKAKDYGEVDGIFRDAYFKNEIVYENAC